MRAFRAGTVAALFRVVSKVLAEESTSHVEKTVFLGALLYPSLTAVAAARPRQPVRCDLGVDGRNVTYFQRDTFADMKWGRRRAAPSRRALFRR